MIDSSAISLRRVGVQDIDRLLMWENSREFWSVSDRNEPLSRGEVELFVRDQDASMYHMEQIRWMIETKEFGTVGTIDLYEIDWDEETACIGILVAKYEVRRQNIGHEALKQLIEIASETLELERLFSRIQPHNQASIGLFSKAGFSKNIDFSDDQVREGEYIQYHTFELWLKK